MSGTREPQDRNDRESTLALREATGGKIDLKAHAIQILNKPHQILASEVRNTFSILLSMNEVTELTVKLGRRFVEVI